MRRYKLISKPVLIKGKFHDSKKNWYIVENYSDDEGKQKRRYVKSLGEMLKRTANAELVKFISSKSRHVKKNKWFTDVKDEYFEDFRQHIESGFRKTSMKTWEDTHTLTYRLDEYFKDHLIKHIDDNTIREFAKWILNARQYKRQKTDDNEERELSDLKISKRTAKLTMDLLGNILHFAYKQGYMESLPEIKRITLPKKKQEIVYFTREEFQDMIDASDNEQLIFVMRFMGATGLRAEEFNKLLWKDVKVSEGYVDIINTRENKPDHKVPISDELMEIIRPVWRKSIKGRVSPYSPNTNISQYIKRLAKNAGIDKNVNQTTFRKSFASWMAQDSFDVFKLSRMMGTSVKMLEDYYAMVEVDELRSEHDKITRKNSKK